MGKGGGSGQFIKGLEIGIYIKVGLALLPIVMGMIKSRQSSAAFVDSYPGKRADASETRPSKIDITDPNVVARNKQRALYKKLNTQFPVSLTRRERGGRRGSGLIIGAPGAAGGVETLVPFDQTNVGFGFVGYQNMLHHYYGSMGGRSH